MAFDATAGLVDVVERMHAPSSEPAGRQGAASSYQGSRPGLSQRARRSSSRRCWR
jgi:hypothetical protein